MSPPSPPRHLSTNIPIGAEKFGGFQLSAKTACLFHRALRIDKERDARPGKMPLVSTYADLDREIRESTLTLLGETLDWEATLDCFAMLVRYAPYYHLYIPLYVQPYPQYTQLLNPLLTSPQRALHPLHALPLHPRKHAPILLRARLLPRRLQRRDLHRHSRPALRLQDVDRHIVQAQRQLRVRAPVARLPVRPRRRYVLPGDTGVRGAAAHLPRGEGRVRGRYRGEV